MSESIGKVGIEVSVDNGKLAAGIADAKRTIASFGNDLSGSIGTATKKASTSIDSYVRNLQTAAATQGKSARETELYKLALRGASAEQLGAANSALRLAEGYQRGQVIGAQLRVGFIALAAAAAGAAVAAAAGTIALINQVGKYQDLSDKIGDTAVNISSLKTASDVTGTSLDTIATASVKLTATLSKTDDESKAAGQAIKALGLDFQKFKAQSPVEQLESVALALGNFADGSEKSAIAVALFGKSGADLLGFLKEYSAEGLKAAYITDAQAKAADDFSDASARLKSQFQQFLQISAVAAIPVLTDIGNLFFTISREQDGTSTSTGIVKGAMSGLLTVFQAVIGLGADVSFVLRGVGRELGAVAAIYASIARLDFKGAFAIGDAVKADSAKARAELDKFQAKLLSIGQGNTIAASQDRPTRGVIKKPKLDISGLIGDKPPKTGGGRIDNSAAQEAKAQLALDLDAIRKTGDALANTISNNEKLLDATRSASLISEASYYAQKRGNLERSNAIQIDAAQQELARLQEEKLTGKDRIDNDRKMADAQAKIVQLRDNGAASLQVLAIQEQASLTAISRAYEDARDSAQSYFDQTQRARQSELDGFGKGNLGRNRTADLTKIRDEYEQKRQDLQRDNRNGKFAGRQDDYERELSLLNEFQAKELAAQTISYAAQDAKRADFQSGASEALRNYYDESRDIYGQTEKLVTNAFQGMEDALVTFVTTGKLSFKGLADSIVADITRMIVKEQLSKIISGSGGGGESGLLGSLISAGASLFGGGGLTTPGSGSLDYMPTRAIGGPVSAGGLYRVNENGPEVLNVAGRSYLMMGNQGGDVSPNAGAGPRPVSVVNHFTLTAPADRRTQSQVAAAAGGGVQRAIARNT